MKKAQTKKIKEQCESIKTVIDEAIDSCSNSKNMTEEEKAFSKNLIDQLEGLNKSFKDEIADLSKNAEWEKFCIAFLGETNAGKSTLIESMRILYNEKTRAEEIEKNKKQAFEDIESYKEIHEKTISDLKNVFKVFKRRLYATGIIAFITGALFMFVISLLIRR